MSTETTAKNETKRENARNDRGAAEATVPEESGAPDRVLNLDDAYRPYRDRLGVGISRFMTRTVALYFRLRNGKPSVGTSMGRTPASTSI